MTKDLQSWRGRGSEGDQKIKKGQTFTSDAGALAAGGNGTRETGTPRLTRLEHGNKHGRGVGGDDDFLIRRNLVGEESTCGSMQSGACGCRRPMMCLQWVYQCAEELAGGGFVSFQGFGRPTEEIPRRHWAERHSGRSVFLVELGARYSASGFWNTTL